MRALVAALLVAAVLAPAAGATFPGKNGRLVYSGDDGLYSILPTGKGARQITKGIDQGASFSPDGRRIAFSRQEPGPAGMERNTIWVAAADGSGAHAVTSFDPLDTTWMGDTQPAWTRDGQLLFSRFVSRYADAHCIFTAPATPLFCGGTDILQYPLPSPVDGRLAFFRSRPRDGRTGMVMADQLWIDGTPTALLATEGDWSPDGKRLLVRQTSGVLGVFDVATGLVAQLGVKAYDFAWSPDGRSLAYIRKGKLWIAAVDGSHAHAVADTASGGLLAWQPLPR